MKLADLPDDFTREQFMRLDRESLDAVPYQRLRWLCQVRGCTNGTHVRDYGISGEKGSFNPLGIWAFLDRNSKNSHKNPQDYWMGPNNYWLCGKHNAMFRRLTPRFGIEHVWKKFIDTGKVVLIAVDDGAMPTVKQIETK